MTRKTEIETKVATDTGFHQGHRIRRGDTFTAPVDFEGNWFKPKGSPEAQAALDGEPDLLDKSAAEIKEVVPGLTLAQINEAIGNEQGGKSRKNVLAILQDARANHPETTGEVDLLN